LNPVLLVIAGPNGSGKTTITVRLRAERWSDGVEYINPDDVARDRFGDWNSPSAVIQAARWAEARREALLAARAGIAFETVFSVPDKVAFLQRARQAGYFVRLFFL
jgi:predicted ABC-type ATPase